MGFPHESAGKESTCNTEDLGLIPGLGRSPRERKGYPLQYSGLENSMDCIVLGIAKNWRRLSNFHFQNWIRASQGGAIGKELTCQCRRHKRHRFNPWVGKIPWRRAGQPTPVFLPGESPWTEEPGRPQSIGRIESDMTEAT